MNIVNMSSDSDTNIMTIAELIDNAFGDEDKNIVHHKHIQTVLYLLARQLRVLERRVAVQIGPWYQSSSSLSVTEIKLQATQKKKRARSKSTSSKQVKQSEKSAGGKTPTARQKSISDKTTSDKTSSDKTSSDNKTLTNKLLSNKVTSSDQPSTDKTLTGKSATDDSSSIKQTVKTTGQGVSDKYTTKDKLSTPRDEKATDVDHADMQDHQKILEIIEEIRERELRVIHQRADSRQQDEKTPTPMASLDSMEKIYEKLLVVERVPVEEARARAAKERMGLSAQAGSQLTVVTQDQFNELASIVEELQKKLRPIGAAGFPENADLMNELRRGASLTDAMAALQLSARLEAAEKTLNNMVSLVINVANKVTGTNLSALDKDVEVIYGGPGDKKESTKKRTVSPPKPKKEALLTESAAGISSHMSTTAADFGALEVKDKVTREELERALEAIRAEIKKNVTSSVTQSAASADTALKIVNKLEGKIETSMNLGNRMENLEDLVASYVEQINVLDTGLSSQMTNYQEELTQMQHELEVGLETMADALANTGGDAAAVAELNSHFNNLQGDIDITVYRQKELQDIQSSLAMDLDVLRKQIELLRETKADREEVIDALRDKAGLAHLNGLVSHQQFDAVRGDFEKRIAAAYDKFNNQEIVWQKAIDDLLRQLNEKADIVQLIGLRGEIYNYLLDFKNKMKLIMDIVGEPNAAALSKRLNRDTACLSCAAPAHMKPENPNGIMLPAVRPPAVGAEVPKPKEDGDHRVCIPGQPIPHPIDPRSHVCQRWCGGSHTVIDKTLNRAPYGVIITQAKKLVASNVSEDEKISVDKSRKPCLQCALPEVTSSSASLEQHKPELLESGDSIITPYHMCPDYISYVEPGAEISNGQP